MSDPNLNSLLDYVDDVLFDACDVIDELDPFVNGAYLEIYSAITWLVPFAEDSRERCASIEDAMELVGNEADMFIPVGVLRLVLDHHTLVSAGSTELNP